MPEFSLWEALLLKPVVVQANGSIHNLTDLLQKSLTKPALRIVLHWLPLMMLCLTQAALAQVSFRSALNMAVSNSPRVKMAQDDLNRARAVVAENRDLYIPSLNAQGGIGRNYGITLNVPTIVTVNTQSLLFSQSQRAYSRAARSGLKATELTLADVKMQVEEDAANTWLGLDTAERRHSVLLEQASLANKLQQVVEQRQAAGIETDLEAKRAHRSALQARLSALYVENEISSLREHLAQLTGLKTFEAKLLAASLPSNDSFAAGDQSPTQLHDNPNVLAAESSAESRLETALGDQRSVKRPQFFFQAQYGRISPINDVSQYYDLHGHYNVFSAAVIINFPIIDKFRQAKARETAADAMHARHEVENARSVQSEERLRFEHISQELVARAELAEVDLGIAEDQLKAILAQTQSSVGNTGGHPPTPQDELNTRFEERQRYLDLLDAQLQLRRTRITHMRVMGTLDSWIAALSAQATSP